MSKEQALEVQAPCTEDSEDCGEGECDIHDPVIEEDVICDDCQEHAQLRRNTGTDCCGGRSRF